MAIDRLVIIVDAGTRPGKNLGLSSFLGNKVVLILSFDSSNAIISGGFETRIPTHKYAYMYVLTFALNYPRETTTGTKRF